MRPTIYPMMIQENRLIGNLNPNDFCYIRIITKRKYGMVKSYLDRRAKETNTS